MNLAYLPSVIISVLAYVFCIFLFAGTSHPLMGFILGFPNMIGFGFWLHRMLEPRNDDTWR